MSIKQYNLGGWVGIYYTDTEAEVVEFILRHCSKMVVKV
jgi:hypothetical protein